jgi:hypothetical protein
MDFADPFRIQLAPVDFAVVVIVFTRDEPEDASTDIFLWRRNAILLQPIVERAAEIFKEAVEARYQLIRSCTNAV